MSSSSSNGNFVGVCFMVCVCVSAVILVDEGPVGSIYSSQEDYADTLSESRIIEWSRSGPTTHVASPKLCKVMLVLQSRAGVPERFTHIHEHITMHLPKAPMALYGTPLVPLSSIPKVATKVWNKKGSRLNLDS